MNILRGLLISSLVVLTVVSLLYFFVATPIQLIAIRIAEGVGWSMLWPTIQAAIADEAQTEVSKSLGLYNIVWSAASAVGPLVAVALIFVFQSIRTIFLLSVSPLATIVVNLVPVVRGRSSSNSSRNNSRNKAEEDERERDEVIILVDPEIPGGGRTSSSHDRRLTRDRRRGCRCRCLLQRLVLCPHAHLHHGGPGDNLHVRSAARPVYRRARPPDRLFLLLFRSEQIRDLSLHRPRRFQDLAPGEEPHQNERHSDVAARLVRRDSSDHPGQERGRIPRRVRPLWRAASGISAISQVEMIGLNPGKRGENAGLLESSIGIGAGFGPIVAGQIAGGSLFIPFYLPASGILMLIPLLALTARGVTPGCHPPGSTAFWTTTLSCRLRDSYEGYAPG